MILNIIGIVRDHGMYDTVLWLSRKIKVVEKELRTNQSTRDKFNLCAKVGLFLQGLVSGLYPGCRCFCMIDRLNVELSIWPAKGGHPWKEQARRSPKI